nr:hypothetical protein [uncultured Glaciecola sp.]
MNMYQRFTLIFTALSLALMFLFPPVAENSYSGGVEYTFYLAKYPTFHSVLRELLILQLVTVTIIGLLLCFAFKSGD